MNYFRNQIFSKFEVTERFEDFKPSHQEASRNSLSTLSNKTKSDKILVGQNC